MRELTPHHQQLDKFIICLTQLTQSLSSLKSLCMHQHPSLLDNTFFFGLPPVLLKLAVAFHFFHKSIPSRITVTIQAVNTQNE